MSDDSKSIPAVGRPPLRDLMTGQLIHICSSCHQILGDSGEWIQPDESFLDRPGLLLTHSVCPECMKRLYPPESYPFLYID